MNGKARGGTDVDGPKGIPACSRRGVNWPEVAVSGPSSVGLASLVLAATRSVSADFSMCL